MEAQNFSQLFELHQNQLYLFACSLTNCEADARDVLQETAIKAFLNFEELEDSSKFKSWAATILHRHVINQHRKNSRRRDLMNKENAFEGHFFNQVTNNNSGVEELMEEDLLKLTRDVGKESVAAFMLYFQGYSYREISSRLGIAIGTVKSRIHFARSKMKQIVDTYEIAA